VIPTRGLVAANIAARTEFFDAQVQAAISDRLPQIVILGAGYDDRPLRFRSPGVHFWELDHPATQRDKERRLRRIGANLDAVTLARVDFRLEGPETTLARAGHDASKPSLFVCEGLLVYLDVATIVKLLAGLRERAAQGSRLTASVGIHAEGLDSTEVAASSNAQRSRGRSEPWRTMLPVADQLDLLRAAGWDGHAALPPRGSMLLVVARPA
jgi:methyltransferase (TIGR00027 family)